MARSNGRAPRSWWEVLNASGPSHDALNRLEEIVANAYTLRSDLRRRMLDPRRDIDDECGYPTWQSITDPEFYQRLYDREAIAARVVGVWPRECWTNFPTVYEDEDSEKTTPFEEAWDALGKQIRGDYCYYADEEGSPVWEELARADELSGVGHFGVVFLGLEMKAGEDLSTPAFPLAVPDSPSFSADTSGGTFFSGGGAPRRQQPQRKAGSYVGPQRRLLYLRSFPEHLVKVTRWENNPGNPRYSQPVVYQITFTDPSQEQVGLNQAGTTRDVHWSRVIHVADTFHQAGVSRVMAVPRMRPVLNRLLDLRKIYGADGETYWRNCVLKLFIETHPELGGDVQLEYDAGGDLSLRQQRENMLNGLQQWMGLEGASAKAISPAVTDPSPHVDTQIDAICVQLQIPKRIFLGSERGELASSQDARAWARRVRSRCVHYVTPCLISPFVDRLIACSVLPVPEEYHVDWPEDDHSTPEEKAVIMEKRANAFAKYVSGDVESLIPPMDYLTREAGYDEEEAEAILKQAEELAEEKEEEQAEALKQMQEQGQQPPVPGQPQGQQQPPPGGEEVAANAGPFDVDNACAKPARDDKGRFAGCEVGGGSSGGGGGGGSGGGSSAASLVDTSGLTKEQIDLVDKAISVHPAEKQKEIAEQMTGLWRQVNQQQSQMKFAQEMDKVGREVQGKLTAAEDKALSGYKSVEYTHINAALREGRAHPDIKHLDSAMQKYSLPGDATVFRGVNHLGDVKVGDVLHDVGYQSTSASLGTAKVFNNAGAVGHVLSITVKKGSHGAWLGGNEQEWLLPRGSRMRVEKVEGNIVHASLE